MKNKDNKNNELNNLENKILENLFIADMMNTTMDGDSSMQNLLMYYDAQDIKEASEKDSKE